MTDLCPILTGIIPVGLEFHHMQGQINSRMYNPAVAARHSQLVSIIDQWRQYTNELVNYCGPTAPPHSSIRQSTKNTIECPHNSQGPRKRLDSRISPGSPAKNSTKNTIESPHNRQGPRKRLDSQISLGSPAKNAELDTDQSLNVV